MKKKIAVLAAAALFVAILPFTACSGKRENSSEYVIDLTFDKDGNRLSGTENFNYYNSTDNEISDLKFNLWGNAYRKDAVYKPLGENGSKAYYDGESYGCESVENVEGCASWEVCGEDKNILSVTLAEPVYPGESAQISITYSLDLAKVNHRTGVTKSTVNLGNFYPVLCAYNTEGYVESPYYSCGDPFVSECANYDVSFTMPAEYIAATSGKEVSRTVAGDKVTTRYELKKARDFAAVLSPDFKTSVKKCGDCEVTLYYCAESEPENALTAACESLEFFSDKFGEYVYPTLSVVITPLSVSGMEYPALTMISDSLEKSETAYTVAHENAHQWWYAMVGSDQLNCAWQDEGLAEYSALCFFETHPSYGYTRTGMLGSAIKSYRAYYSVYNQIFGKSDTSMTRNLKDFDSDYEYVNIAYNKGLLAFESVRTAMGDEQFFAALKEYCADNLYKIASPEELVSHFTARRDVEGLIMGYVDGKVVI